MRAPMILAGVLMACGAGASNFDRLAPIETSGRSELRITIAHYPSALRTAYVVTPTSIIVFDYDGSRWRTALLKRLAATRCWARQAPCRDSTVETSDAISSMAIPYHWRG
jgi:hypothetical protein